MSQRSVQRKRPSPSGLSPVKRSQILEGARHVFSGCGYEVASMEMIAASAGVSKATLYNHFEDKRALFAEYVRVECERQVVEIFVRPADADSSNPREVLHTIGMSFLAMVLSPMGLAMWRSVVAESKRFPEFGKIMEASGPARGRVALAAYLNKLSESRLVDFRGQPTTLVASQFIALCQAGITTRVEFGQAAEIPIEERDAAVRSAVEVILRAYARTAPTAPG